MLRAYILRPAGNCIVYERRISMTKLSNIYIAAIAASQIVAIQNEVVQKTDTPSVNMALVNQLKEDGKPQPKLACDRVAYALCLAGGGSLVQCQNASGCLPNSN
jgi:predicted nucleic acid-binding protein